MPLKDKNKRKEYKKNYNRRRYTDNSGYREKQIEHVRNRRKEMKEWFWDLKTKYTCETCGFSHPACIDFHHHSGKKEADLSKAISSKGWGKERILKEIKKCKVLCSNCHRILHFDKPS